MRAGEYMPELRRDMVETESGVSLDLTPLEVLLVEDNPADARLATLLLEEASAPGFVVTQACRLAEALDHLSRGGVDVIALDLSLPDAQGIAMVARLHELAPHVPVVILSGTEDEALAVAGVREGAQDYLVKGRADGAGLARTLRHAVERQRAATRLTYLAYHDPLTGLPNRALFQDRLALAVARAHRHGERLAVLFVDLDGFKAVNDTRGHEAGDHLLREVARRLRACTRESDTVARLAGDEFTILLPDAATVEQAVTVAGKVVAAIGAGMTLDGAHVSVTTSVGIGLYPDDGGDAARLLRAADTAMYRAKGQGKNRYAVGSIPSHE